MSAPRIQYLDGLRGVAILMVVLFHAYARWAAIEPFHQAPSVRQLFAHGWLGVELFFAISGYVIYLSLTRSPSLPSFAFSRWLRLAPAMLVASLVILLAANWLGDTPLGQGRAIDLLPSLTFLDPLTLRRLLGIEVHSLSGAFWSLYVEVKFYALAALLYFPCRDRSLKGLVVLYVVYGITTLLHLAGLHHRLPELARSLLTELGLEYYPWFIAGIFTYRYLHGGAGKHLGLTLVAMAVGGLVAGFQKPFTPGLAVGIALVPLLFLAPVFSARARQWLAARWLAWLGFVSYPLYLLHENLVTGHAILLAERFPGWPAVLYPVPFLILVALLAHGVAVLEPRLRAVIRGN